MARERECSLLCCAGWYAYPLIRQHLGNAVESMIMTRFGALELAQKLEELDLGFQVEGAAFTDGKKYDQYGQEREDLESLG